MMSKRLRTRPLWMVAAARGILGNQALLILIILMAIGCLVSSEFRSINNLWNLLRQVSVEGVLAVGLTFVILTGGIDLSVESTAALSSMIVVLLLGLVGLPLSLVTAVLFGAAVGLGNGLIIAKARSNPVIVTIGTWIALRGVCLVITGGQVKSTNMTSALTAISDGSLIGIPYPFLLFVLLAVVSSLILKNFAIGRSIFALGGNSEAAALVGISRQRVELFVYSTSAVIASIAGILLASRLQVAQPLVIQGSILNVIAAVVLGGTRLSGGKGSILGTVWGVLVIGIVNNMFDMLSIPLDYQKLTLGIVIVLAILLGKTVTSEVWLPRLGWKGGAHDK